MTRAMQILGYGGLIEAMRGWLRRTRQAQKNRRVSSHLKQANTRLNRSILDGTTATGDEIPAEPAIHIFNCYALAFSHTASVHEVRTGGQRSARLREAVR